MEDWDVDLLSMSLDDIIVLNKGMGGNPEQVKEVLGRMVTNKTEEEIGKMSLRDLNAALDKALGELQELAVPKASAAP